MTSGGCDQVRTIVYVLIRKDMRSQTLGPERILIPNNNKITSFIQEPFHRSPLVPEILSLLFLTR